MSWIQTNLRRLRTLRPSNSGPKLFDPVEGENTVNTSKAPKPWVPIRMQGEKAT